MKKLFALVKRESLEYKNKAFMLPIVTALVFLALFYLSIELSLLKLVPDLTESLYETPYMIYGLASSLIGVYFLMLFFSYPLTSLFQDRKDGSIAFFRSMPYSESLEFISKIIFLIMVIPMTFVIIEAAFYFLTMPLIICLSKIPNLQLSYALDTIRLMPYVFLNILWVLPYFAYLFLCSALAKRSPLLLAATPIVIIGVVEKIALNSQQFILLVFKPLVKLLQLRISTPDMLVTRYPYPSNPYLFLGPTPKDYLNNYNISFSHVYGHTFTSPIFWCGTAVAIVIFGLTILARKVKTSNCI